MTQVDQERLLQDGRWLYIQLEQCVSRRLAPRGITAVQSHILLFLLCREEQGTPPTDTHRPPGYTTAPPPGMVKRLREKGYIRVERCEEDDRRRLLFATEKARQLWPALEETIQGVHSRLYDGFSQEELSALDHLQGKRLQRLSALAAQSQKQESKS